MKEAAEEVPKELKEEVEDSDGPFGKLGKGCDVDIAVCSLKIYFRSRKCEETSLYSK